MTAAVLLAFYIIWQNSPTTGTSLEMIHIEPVCPLAYNRRMSPTPQLGLSQIALIGKHIDKCEVKLCVDNNADEAVYSGSVGGGGGARPKQKTWLSMLASAKYTTFYKTGAECEECGGRRYIKSLGTNTKKIKARRYPRQ